MKLNVKKQGMEKRQTSMSFEERIPESRKRIYALAYRMLGNRCDAEDVVQDILLRAWTNLSKIDSARSFDGWMSRIATNLCIDRLRRRRRTEISLDSTLSAEAFGEGSVSDLADVSKNPEKILFAKEIDAGLRQGLRSLPANYRECLVMLAQDHTYVETAATQNCPVGTVRSRMHRARVHLNRVLGR